MMAGADRNSSASSIGEASAWSLLAKIKKSTVNYEKTDQHCMRYLANLSKSEAEDLELRFSVVFANATVARILEEIIILAEASNLAKVQHAGEEGGFPRKERPPSSRIANHKQRRGTAPALRRVPAPSSTASLLLVQEKGT